MKRRTGLLLAVAVVLGSVTGGALAGWRDDAELSATVRPGYVHYAVGDAQPGGPLRDEATFAGTEGTPGWSLPQHMLGELSYDTPQTAVVQVDGYAEGNRGLRYWLEDVTVEGDGALLDAAHLRIAEVDAPAQCVPRLPLAPVEPGEPVPTPTDPLEGAELLYEGAVREASFEADRVLVGPADLTGDDAESWQTHSRTHYLCLELSVPELRYENTASASAVVPGDQPFIVTDTDSWSAMIEPTAQQRSADVTLHLPYGTYRTGAALDRDLLAVEIVHTNAQATYAVGDTLEFTYQVVNLTDAAAGSALLESNLIGDVPGCREMDHAPGALRECSFGSRVVRQSDVDAGSFTPVATWGLYSSTGYGGEVVSLVRVTGAPVSLAR